MNFKLFTIHRAGAYENIAVTVNPVALVILLGVIAAFLFFGCAHKPKPPAPPVITLATDTVPPPRVFVPHHRDTVAIAPRFFAQVYFAFDSDSLTEAGLAATARAGSFLASHPGYVVRVYGYADTTGRDGYNDSLSQRRAEKTCLSIRSDKTFSICSAIGKGETRGDPARARHATILVTP